MQGIPYFIILEPILEDINWKSLYGFDIPQNKT